MLNTHSDLQFLAGGGEMARLTREKDWSTSSIGTPDTWPQSLRTALNILLHSKFPMFLFWGPELLCFYNDAYRPSLGNDGKHPAILGGKAAEFWKEIWDDIQPIIANVLEKGEANFNEDMLLPIYRNGAMEEVYWTFSYSPIHDESGKPAGVFVACSETTEKVRIIKELKTSNDRFINNLRHAPIAMCAFRGEDLRVEVVNDLMLQIWEKEYDDVINQPYFEVVPETKHQGLESMLQTVYKTGETFSATESPIVMLRNGQLETAYLNFVCEALKETDGSISGVICTAIDVTKQVVDKKRLEETEHKIRALVENAPFAIAVYTGEEMRIELANQSIIEIWGKGNDVIGKTFTELLPELTGQEVFEQIKQVYKTGTSFHTENTPLDLNVNGKLGTYYFNYSFTPLYDVSGKIYGVMNTGVDLTDLNLAKQKVEESEKRFRSTVTQAPTAIAIFRGADYVTEMANDAYLELVDRKESDFINRPLFETLPEVKDVVKPLLDGVMHTGIPFKGNEIAAPIVRGGHLNTYYFDLLYHPLKEPDGTISGVLVTAVEVTEQVKARKEIEQNEERLKIVLDASELGTWELNSDTGVVQFSDRFIEILSGEKQSNIASQKDLIKHIHPDDLEIRGKAFKDAMISGHLWYQTRIIWNDNSLHWMEAKGKVLFDADKKPLKLMGTIRDITNEVQAQQSLIESEKKFRLLSDSMPQLIWTSDTEGNLNYFNKSVVEYSGLSLDQIFDNGWLSIVHPDDRENNTKTWIESITTGKDFHFEHRFLRHDGEYRWQLSRAIPQYDANGNINMWVGSSTDIHDQKTFAHELEIQVIERTKELHKSNETLKQSEERYHLMVDEVQDYAILYLSPAGIIENWNKGAEKIKGYKAEEIIGKCFSVFYTAEDRESNLPMRLIEQAATVGRYFQEGWRVRKDGTHFWANVVITAVRNSKGDIIGFSKVTHDLTAKKEADDKIKLNAAQLEQKNSELEKMNKELQSFAYISSHDLQEPLRKIQTFSNQIVEREFDNLSESGKDKFERMQNAAKRMQTLINDLLSYSRTTTQDRKLVKANLNDIFNEVKDDLKEELLQKYAVLEIENVQCDVEIIAFQIHQLMYNLISNSLKFARENIPPVITIKCEINKGASMNLEALEPDTEYCHITLSDNGIGFDPQYSDKIFEVFQRLHGRESYQGTGIGLAIVKKIIDNHNGFITATGEVNKGATFNIYLPIKAK